MHNPATAHVRFEHAIGDGDGSPRIGANGFRCRAIDAPFDASLSFDGPRTGSDCVRRAREAVVVSCAVLRIRPCAAPETRRPEEALRSSSAPSFHPRVTCSSCMASIVAVMLALRSACRKQLVSCAFSIARCACCVQRRATAACRGGMRAAHGRPGPGRAAEKNLAGVLTVEKTVIRFRCNRRRRRRE